MTLWKQFVGVASAVAYLHMSADIAHLDIKSSNILIYCDGDADQLILKVTDFSSSRHLPRKAAGKAFSRDIWALGCTFTELLSYLVRNGPTGACEFRTSITTVIDKIHSDSFDDNSSGNHKIMNELLTWISLLSSESEKAAQLEPLLRRMLSDKFLLRPKAEEVCKSLVEVRTL